MSGRYILDEQGNAVACGDLMTWAAWFENAKTKLHVAYDTIDEHVTVSTVFLGLDHNFQRNGPPILWETMVFGGEHDGYQERYATREGAVVGHEMALAMVRKLEAAR